METQPHSPYQIISPPFSTRDFRKLSKKELKAYNEWFHQVLPERIRILTATVKATKGYEHWEADGTPDSLNSLGDWLPSQIERLLNNRGRNATVRPEHPTSTQTCNRSSDQRSNKQIHFIGHGCGVLFESGIYKEPSIT